MITQNKSKIKITLFEKLNIDKQRYEFLKNKCNELYEQNGQSNEKDVIDIIHEMRIITQNAQEDILVCYLIGHIHGRLGAEYQAQFIGDIIANIFK